MRKWIRNKSKISSFLKRTNLLMFVMAFFISTFVQCILSGMIFYEDRKNMDEYKNTLLKQYETSSSILISSVAESVAHLADNPSVISSAILYFKTEISSDIVVLSTIRSLVSKNPYINNAVLYVRPNGKVYPYSGEVYKFKNTKWAAILEEYCANKPVAFSIDSSLCSFGTKIIDGHLFMICDFLQSFHEPLATLIIECNIDYMYANTFKENSAVNFSVYVFDEYGGLIRGDSEGYDQDSIARLAESGSIYTKVFSAVSELNGWNYYLISEISILQNFAHIMLKLLPIFLLIFFVCVVITQFIAKRVTRPINSFFNVFAEETPHNGNVFTPGENEFESILRIYNDILQQNRITKKLLVSVSSQITASLLRDIIFGGEIETERIENTLFGINSTFCYNSPSTILIISADACSLKDQQVFLSNICSNVDSVFNIFVTKYHMVHHLLEIQSSVICVIQSRLSVDEIEFGEQIKEVVTRIETGLSVNGCMLFCGIGSVCSNLGLLKSSYLEASAQLYKILHFHGNITVNNVSQSCTTPWLDIFAELFKTVYSVGFNFDNKRAIEIINACASSTAVPELHNIFYGFIMQTVDAMRSLNIDAKNVEKFSLLTETDFWKINDPELLVQIMQEKYGKANLIFETQLKKRNNKYVRKVLDIIEHNYADQNLSLHNIANQLNISRTYISTLFNDCMGMNFAVFLSGYRVEKAKEFMLSGSHTIKEISQIVGFLTVQNFINSFKRMTGKTPKQWQNKF